MQKNENPVILAVILFAITAVAALILAATNNLTALKIEENTTKEQNEARVAVMPDANKFEKLDVLLDEESLVTEIYAGKNPPSAAYWRTPTPTVARACKTVPRRL